MMTYMDKFVREVLRMHPVVTKAVHRECVEDTDVNDHKISKGAFIQADVLSVHFDHDLWGPLPVDEFHPERHDTKRHPMSFLAFGAGPRTCIGARFALRDFDDIFVRMDDWDEMEEFQNFCMDDIAMLFYDDDDVVFVEERRGEGWEVQEDRGDDDVVFVEERRGGRFRK
ncbi:unnamed protein product, partial [Didymodactylos carnosus]